MYTHITIIHMFTHTYVFHIVSYVDGRPRANRNNNSNTMNYCSNTNHNNDNNNDNSNNDNDNGNCISCADGRPRAGSSCSPSSRCRTFVVVL